MTNEKGAVFDFNMVTGEEKQIKVPYKQMIVILEALNNLKKDIEEFAPKGPINKMRFANKLEEVNYLIEVIENGTEYNFHKMTEKCIKKKFKKDDPGLDPFSAAIEIKSEKDKKELGKN